MIEFKGAYSNKATKESKSVLVQFDGILLHIWQRSDPFCRLLTSDVFTLPPVLGKRKRYIKLPNGGKIETDDLEAFSLLHASKRTDSCLGKEGFFLHWRCILWIGSGIFLAGVLVFLHRLFFAG